MKRKTFPPNFFANLNAPLKPTEMKILIAEDNESSRLILQLTLEAAGHEVITTENGAAAWAILEREDSPSLAILDWMMPEMDGLEVCRRVRQQEGVTPVYIIFLTAKADKTDIVQGLEAGANDYVLKPFNREELYARVKVGETVVNLQRDLAARFAELEDTLDKHKRVKIELNETQRFLHTVIDNMPSLIYVRDIKGNFVLVNQALADNFGKSPAELIGKTDADFSHNPEEARKIIEEDMQILQNLEEKFIPEEKHIDARGNVHWYQTVKRSIVLGENGNRYLVGVATDFTERKIMESQFHHLQKMESIGQLAAGIAHEINTPTQYVGDNTRFIRDAFTDFSSVLRKYGKLLDSAQSGAISPELISEVKKEIDSADLAYLLEEVPKALQQSLDGVSRIAKIVQSMKDFAHPGTREKQFADLNRAIESTVTVARNEWKYVADVENHFDENLPLVPCFLGEFNQVILNMVINAAHAITDVVGDGSQGKGKITITTTKVNDNWAEVRIGDTGNGIPAEVQGRIFDPFFTTKEVGKGTGQGLSISHTVVVEKHSGQLSFETESGQGTTFIIRLPLETSGNSNQDGNINYD